MGTAEEARYMYLGTELNLPEFRFIKGGVYYGKKLNELKEKYPLLDKILVKTEDLASTNVNETYLQSITEEIRKEVEGEIE